MMRSHGTCSIPPNDEVLLEEDWHRFFMGYLAGPVPENEMVKFKVRGDVGGKAGVYYFVLFRLSIKTAIDSEEIVAIVSDANGDLDHSLSERFLEIAHNNLSKDWTQPDISFSREVFAILRDRALDYMSDIKHQRELTARQRNDALIEIWRAAMEQAFDVQKQRATAKLKAATDNRVVRMYQEVLRGLDSKLQNARAELKARKQVSIVYEPAAYGLMELLGEGTSACDTGVVSSRTEQHIRLQVNKPPFLYGHPHVAYHLSL